MPQQSRDIIPAFSVAVGMSSKIPKKRRTTLTALEAVNIVDDLKGLQLTLRVTVTRIKVFVSSYIAMKAVRMMTNAEKIFAPATPEDGGGGGQGAQSNALTAASPSAARAKVSGDTWAPTQFKDANAQDDDDDADGGGALSYKEQALEAAAKMADATKAIQGTKKKKKKKQAASGDGDDHDHELMPTAAEGGLSLIHI